MHTIICIFYNNVAKNVANFFFREKKSVTTFTSTEKLKNDFIKRLLQKYVFNKNNKLFQNDFYKKID
jgi:hypothetical protein